MYEQPQTNAQEYLLGKAVVEKPEESDVKKVPRHPPPTPHARTHAHTHRHPRPHAQGAGGGPNPIPDPTQVEVLPGSNFINGQNNLSNQVNEEFNKLNNDPLIMMRSEEQKVQP